MSATTDTASILAANRRGIILMSAAMSVFIVNDMLMKIAAETMPASQAIGIRGMMSATWILIVALAMTPARELRWVVEPRILARCTLDIIGSFAYLVALFHMPIATATAINTATPIFLTVLAVFLLRESVGWRRWSAVAVGFAGVLLVVRPTTEGLNWWALLVLAATAVLAFRDIYTRRIPDGAPSIVISLSNALWVGMAGCVLAPFDGWRAMEGRDWLLLGSASLFLAIGYHWVIIAMRSGEASVIGAFRYSGLLWAVIIGWVVWSQVPDGLTWAGIALIVGAGLYIVHRERVRGRQRT